MNKTYEMQVGTMLGLQDSINSKIDIDWKDKNRPWNRAVWIECAEMMDHLGYKWWKDNPTNLEQSRMELVNIWHFGLSYYAENDITMSDMAPVFEAHLENVLPASVGVLLYHCEALAEAAMSRPGFPLREFIIAMNYCSMDMDVLFTMYVGKNLLNMFRQEYGYKEGTYIKEWFGEEDNVVLTRIVNGLDASAPDFTECVRSGLVSKYQEVLTHQATLEGCDK